MDYMPGDERKTRHFLPHTLVFNTSKLYLKIYLWRPPFMSSKHATRSELWVWLGGVLNQCQSIVCENLWITVRTSSEWKCFPGGFKSENYSSTYELYMCLFPWRTCTMHVICLSPFALRFSSKKSLILSHVYQTYNYLKVCCLWDLHRRVQKIDRYVNK